MEADGDPERLLDVVGEALVELPQGHTGLMFPIYLTDGEVFELTIFIQTG